MEKLQGILLNAVMVQIQKKELQVVKREFQVELMKLLRIIVIYIMKEIDQIVKMNLE
jgi:hypothetical protein